MTTSVKTAETIRIGIFDDVPTAERAVAGLIQAGFLREQISVLCSDEAKERQFPQFRHEEPASNHLAEFASTGGVLGGLLGAAVSIGVTTAAGLSLIAAGPSFLVGGAVLGGLIGAMQTRGYEGPLADFYDQSLSQGKLLVAVEDQQSGYAERLRQAEQVFRNAGAVPVPLPSEPTPLSTGV